MKYECLTCNYVTDRKSNYLSHINSKKHKKLAEISHSLAKISQNLAKISQKSVKTRAYFISKGN